MLNTADISNDTPSSQPVVVNKPSAAEEMPQHQVVDKINSISDRFKLSVQGGRNNMF